MRVVARRASTLLGVLALLGWATTLQGAVVEGFTEPYRTIEVAAGEPGVITSVLVREGERVKKGQLLATLDSDVLKATLRMARQKAASVGRIASATAELELRQDRVEKLSELHEKGHAMLRELERAQADLAIAEAAMVLAREERLIDSLECERIEAQIERRKINSPADGVIVDTHKEIGESILANDPSVLTLVQLHPLRVKFPVSLGQATGLKVGQELSFSMPGVKGDVTGTIEVVAPVMDAKSGTVQVSVVIENEDNRIRSGTRCILRLPDNSVGEQGGLSRSLSDGDVRLP